MQFSAQKKKRETDDIISNFLVRDAKKFTIFLLSYFLKYTELNSRVPDGRNLQVNEMALLFSFLSQYVFKKQKDEKH